MNKSSTDIHWNERASRESDDAKVNIADVVQRELETSFILEHLPLKGKILEVGCGNGFLTNQLRDRAEHVDAFDFSENMVERARRSVGERNNRFFHASVLSMDTAQPSSYTTVVCVRVLINLENLAQQATALHNMHAWLKPGGVLILVEGFRDGFDGLNGVREAAGIPRFSPAKINFYSSLSEFLPLINEKFSISAEWHSGMFDFLTRVVYPALVGSQAANGPSEFHNKIKPIAASFNPKVFETYARLKGYCLVKR